MPIKVCVEYEETCIHSEEEGGSYGSWSEDYSSSVTGAYIIGDDEKAAYASETFIVPDGTDTVYVVYMIYRTGNSFGSADGKIDILHCTASSDAAHKLASIVTSNPHSGMIKFTDDFGRDISIDNRGAGYFERISFVEVVQFDISKGKKSTRYMVN